MGEICRPDRMTLLQESVMYYDGEYLTKKERKEALAQCTLETVANVIVECFTMQDFYDQGNKCSLIRGGWLGLRSCMLLPPGGGSADEDLSAIGGMQPLTRHDRALAGGLIASLGPRGEEGWCTEVRDMKPWERISAKHFPGWYSGSRLVVSSFHN